MKKEIILTFAVMAFSGCTNTGRGLGSFLHHKRDVIEIGETVCSTNDYKQIELDCCTPTDKDTIALCSDVMAAPKQRMVDGCNDFYGHGC